MEPLAIVTRSGFVESVHCGYVCAADASGRVVHSIGDPETKIFFRSSAKPIQSLPLIRSGAARAYSFTPREIAIACASHTGAPEHQRVVRGILAKLGLGENALHCGAAAPIDFCENGRLLKNALSPTALHNCCSGKHAAMLALAKYRNLSLEDYESADHPVQQEILSAIAEFTDEEAVSIPVGIDGCGAPVYLLPIGKIAMAYARLAQYSGDTEHPFHSACKAVFNAMTAYPELVAGEKEFCTELMRAAGGRLIGKCGSEAVYCVGVRGANLGICVKIADGYERAVYPAVMQTLSELQLLKTSDFEKLKRWYIAELKNSPGDAVGTVRPYSGKTDPMGKSVAELP